MEKVKIFTIDCSTGCSCCRSENHERGPFSTHEIALGRMAKYREIRLLASQYARYGVYHIFESIADQLPDGRLICGNTVYDKFMDDETPGGLDERCP